MIKGFIHCYGTEAGQRILLEQINRIKHSGLWEGTERVFVGSVGNQITLADDPKLTHFHHDDATEFELWTLDRLFEECQRDDCLCWYIHTKGASHHDSSRDWRHHMELIVIDRWHDCAEALLQANTCGALGHNNPEPFYAGNFWWTKSPYVRTLMNPTEWAANAISRGGAKRWCAETWIIQNNYHLHLFYTRWTGVQ
jgi:hypothetical protein